MIFLMTELHFGQMFFSFQIEKRILIGLTYVDKQLIKASRRNLFWSSLTNLGNRAASSVFVFVFIFVSICVYI